MNDKDKEAKWGKGSINAGWYFNIGPMLAQGAYRPEFSWVKEYALRKAFNDNVLKLLKDVQPPTE